MNNQNIKIDNIWEDVVPSKDELKVRIADVAFSPDGSLVVVAVRNRVLLYKADDGTLIESLLGHKDIVNCVDFNSDGTRFASGGSDNTVVIWKSTGEGVLKYPHGGSVHSVKFRPFSLKLASCSDVDLGIWSPDQKQVLKEKESSKILCAAWSTDGGIIALGMESGMISIRNDEAIEIQRLERKESVKSLLFLPYQPDNPSVLSPDGRSLIVGSWDKTLSYYILQDTSHKLLYEKSLKFYPTKFSLAGHQAMKGNSFILSGSNGKSILLCKEGTNLIDLVQKDCWIWSHACHPATDRVVIGTDDGCLKMIKINYGGVFALYSDRYAYQENLTEVIIQNLLTDKRVRIKCKDLVSQLSLYKNKLVVRLNDRICVYESNPDDSYDIHYQLRRERIAIQNKVKYNISITSSHLVLFSDSSVELYTFDCNRQRIWNLDSKVTAVKQNGGIDGKESFIIGCEDGTILKLFIDNSFVMELAKHQTAIASVDISITQTKMLSVDEKGNLMVTNIKTQQILFSTSNVITALFNQDIDDMISYSVGNNTAFVVSSLSSIENSSLKGNQSSPCEIPIPGPLIHFQAQKLYCLLKGNLVGIDISQSANIIKAISQNDHVGAYKMACIGATENDWKLLAYRSLQAGQLDVAKKAFVRSKDIRFLTFIDYLEKKNPFNYSTHNTQLSKSLQINVPNMIGKDSKILMPTSNLDPIWQAEILAFQGMHLEAAKLYNRAGKPNEAVRLLTDLRLYDDAKLFAQNSGFDSNFLSELTAQQAVWLKETNNWRGAAELYMSLGQNYVGVKIIGESQEEGWANLLIDVARRIPVETNQETLLYCAEKFDNHDIFEFACEIYKKLGEVSKLMSLYSKRNLWAEAAALAESNTGKFDVSVFLPYAEWLVSQERYDDAINAYKKAGRSDLGIKILKELLSNSIKEKRFKDSSFYSWTISNEYYCISESSSGDEWLLTADIYYAFSTIHSFITEPFTSYQPDTLFQISRFILNALTRLRNIPSGVSEAITLYTLGRQAMTLNMFKLARQVFDRLSKLIVPVQKQNEIELSMLILQSKPVRDDSDNIPVCYRCSSTNSPINPYNDKYVGDVCTTCGHPFIRSFINFDVLPLVEFVPEAGISDNDAIKLILDNVFRHNSGKSAIEDRPVSSNSNLNYSNQKSSNTNMIILSNDEINSENELFTKCVTQTLDKQVSKKYIPVSLDANTLLSLKRSEVFVCRSANNSTKFYRNMLPDIRIAISHPCNKFFHLEDLELEWLTNKKCPYSRIKNIGDYGSL